MSAPSLHIESTDSMMNELEQVQVAVFFVTVGTMSIRHYLKPISGLPIASYPGLLAPAFVACSTSAGEGLVKLSHMV